jgi:hypothetical protein
MQCWWLFGFGKDYKCIKHVGFIKMKDHFVVSMASTSVSNSTKRSDNFAEEEAQLLVSLVAQNKLKKIKSTKQFHWL